MKSIRNITIAEVEKLFELANFDGFTITNIIPNDDSCVCDEVNTDCIGSVLIMAESMWDGVENPIEDEIVYLCPQGYHSVCQFSKGFSIPMSKYIQWSLWCGLIEQIDFEGGRTTTTRKVQETSTLEFVSYDGKFPSLCNGKLILKYNGIEHAMVCVLDTGGGFTSDYDVITGKWTIAENRLPKELRHCITEITELVNTNIQYGCCGGCS